MYGQDGEVVEPDVVREAPREEILEVEDMIEKIEKAAAVKETFKKLKTAGVVNGKINQVVEERIDRTAKVEAVEVAKVAEDKKGFGDVIANQKLTEAAKEKEKLEENYFKIVEVNEDKHVKVEKLFQAEGKDIVEKYAKSKHVKVKIDKIGEENVKVADAKKAGKTAEDRGNDEARVGVRQVRKCGTGDAQSVSPVSESSVQIVEKVWVGVFAAESEMFQSAVGAGPMYNQKHRDNRHAYSKSYEMNGGKGAGDLKQQGRSDVVEQGSPLEQLVTDVSQVEEPDGLKLVVDQGHTKKVKAIVIAKEEIKRIDVIANAKAVKVVQVAVNEKEFGNVITHTKLGVADEKKLDEKYVKIKVAQSKHGKVRVDEIVGKYADGFYVKIDKDTVKADKSGVKYVEVTDDKNTGNEIDTKENDEARASASQFVRCVTDVSKSVGPVWRHSQPSVEKEGAEVFDAVSVVSKSVVWTEFVYGQEYRADEHMYRDKYRMDGGRGAVDLKLFADVSLVEKPNEFMLIMDHEYTERYKSAKHMYSEEYKMDSDQGAGVFTWPGRLDVAERSSPLPWSFAGVSWVEETSGLGRRDVWLARTAYNEKLAGMVQKGSRDSWKSFPKWGCGVKVDCFVC